MLRALWSANAHAMGAWRPAFTPRMTARVAGLARRFPDLAMVPERER
jgi:hypothetical protein